MSEFPPVPARIDERWNRLIEDGKHPNLVVVVKNTLIISHGLASVERGFSLSERILSEQRASMNECTVNFKLFVADRLCRVGGSAQKVCVTEDLIKLAKSAQKRYQNYLEWERELRKDSEKNGTSWIKNNSKSSS